MDNYIIKKTISGKVLMLGEYFYNNAPGGMAAVLASYNKYIEDMKFISTWKAGNLLVKLWYIVSSFIKFLWIILTDKEIKIVHIQGAAFGSFERNMVLIKLARLFNKKVIHHIHCADFESYYNPSKHKKKIIDSINSCDMFVVLSDEWKKYFISIGVNESIIKVLNNIVSPPIFKDIPKKIDRLNILYLGIIGKRKGVYDLLDVLGDNRELFQNKINLRIGGNKEENIITKAIKDKKISNFVTFEGFVTDDKKNECLNWCDVYVLPSYNEGLPISILEAMSYKHPIISTNVGGIPRVLQNHVNGIMIEPGNKDELKESLMFFINNPSKVKEYGDASFNIVQNYLPHSVFHYLNNLYSNLLTV